ncbi:hypothetical protein [Actinomadura formosensis]|uniref:hypothetical protein n=1 Tax=Actinomadura formosensis TaxID=60706 RepID=UPI003D90A999
MPENASPSLDDLKARYPEWNIIRTRQGGWWAQRFPVPPEEFNRPNMVDARTPEELAVKIDKVME